MAQAHWRSALRAPGPAASAGSAPGVGVSRRCPARRWRSGPAVRSFSDPEVAPASVELASDDLAEVGCNRRMMISYATTEETVTPGYGPVTLSESNWESGEFRVSDLRKCLRPWYTGCRPRVHRRTVAYPVDLSSEVREDRLPRRLQDLYDRGGLNSGLDTQHKGQPLSAQPVVGAAHARFGRSYQCGSVRMIASRYRNAGIRFNNASRSVRCGRRADRIRCEHQPRAPRRPVKTSAEEGGSPRGRGARPGRQRGDPIGVRSRC
jgi:hypothetical protein